MSDSVVIVGGFGDEEMIPTLVEGFHDVGMIVHRIPSRGVIEQHRQRDAAFAAKETIEPPVFPTRMPFVNDAEFCEEIRDVCAEWKPRLLLWWYAKDDRPNACVERLSCPTVRFSWDDPMALSYGEDYSRGFTHAVTSCRDSIPHYESRGTRAMWTLPPVSPTRHGQATPTPGEECDVAFSFFTLYNGTAPYLCERVKRRDLMEAAAAMGVKVHIYGRRERFGNLRVPEESFRGFRDNMELPGCYAAAKIVVTQHPQCDAAGYVSPRDAEALASGSYLISDDAAGIVEAFVGQVGVYFDADCFRDTLAIALASPRFHHEWAKEAQAKYVSEYSGRRFAERLLEFVGRA